MNGNPNENDAIYLSIGAEGPFRNYVDVQDHIKIKVFDYKISEKYTTAE